MCSCFEFLFSALINGFYLINLTHSKIRHLGSIVNIVDGSKYYLRSTMDIENIPDIKKIENSYLTFMNQYGVESVYNRYNVWRAWKRIKYPKVGYKTQFYKCQKTCNNETSICTNRYWDIEETAPPCSFEIYSARDAYHICAIPFGEFATAKQCHKKYLKNRDELLKQCRSHIIVTRWQFITTYGDAEYEPDRNIFCDSDDVCEIVTMYKIGKKSIIFRILNTSYKILYSRIMLFNGKQMSCFSDCGRVDKNWQYVKRNNNHLNETTIAPNQTINNIIPIQKIYNPITKRDTARSEETLENSDSRDEATYGINKNRIQYSNEKTIENIVFPTKKVKLGLWSSFSDTTDSNLKYFKDCNTKFDMTRIHFGNPVHITQHEYDRSPLLSFLQSTKNISATDSLLSKIKSKKLCLSYDENGVKSNIR